MNTQVAERYDNNFTFRIRFEVPVTQPVNPLEDDLFAFLGEPKQKIRLIQSLHMKVVLNLLPSKGILILTKYTFPSVFSLKANH